MHASTLLQVPGDGTNELRVGLDWECRGLEPGLGDVLRRKLDEVVEVTADFVDLSRHGKQDLAEPLQELLHLSRLASRGVVVLAVEVAGTLGLLLCAAGFPAGLAVCGTWYPLGTDLQLYC